MFIGAGRPKRDPRLAHRVHHDPGHPRTVRGEPEPALCAGCGAVYTRRHWRLGPSAEIALGTWHGAPLQIRLCPGCRRRGSGLPRGYVHITGKFFADHRTEMEQLLHNEVRRAREDNPVAQVMDWRSYGTGGLLITTTTEHLAKRLGQALDKAFGGTVRYGFAHDSKLAHVWWTRE